MTTDEYFENKMKFVVNIFKELSAYIDNYYNSQIQVVFKKRPFESIAQSDNPCFQNILLNLKFKTNSLGDGFLFEFETASWRMIFLRFHFATKFYGSTKLLDSSCDASDIVSICL